ncbi:MAG: sigma-54-dependent Fis family transcriptional regulator [bacterium]|nr:sigma-54-dependent Fis family transcriptional regulator [bacterium]
MAAPSRLSIPSPHSLLVEHTAMPMPVPGRTGLELDIPPAMRQTRLSRADRVRLAVQLLSATALLAEFELWPGVQGLRRSTIVKTDDGLQVRLPQLPLPLSTVLRRLGGGARAGDLLRTEVTNAVEQVTGLPEGMLSSFNVGAGFFVEPVLESVLKELGEPLDSATAQALWAIRFEAPPLPSAGETHYWKVTEQSVAARLGAALWAAIRKRSGQAWIQLPSSDRRATGPLPSVGKPGTLILCGAVSSDDLVMADRWSRQKGCSAVVFGQFPAGWNPPLPPVFDSTRIAGSMAITGHPPERCRALIEDRRGIFNPFEPADRSALTRQTRFASNERRITEESRTDCDLPDRVRRILSLRREGVPESLVMLASDSRIDRLRERAVQHGVVVSNGTWRLEPSAVPCRDELHAEIVDLFAPEDPHRLVHMALAGEGHSELLNWASERVAELEAGEVVALIDPKTAAVISSELVNMVAIACLCQMDAGGARRAIALLPEGPDTVLANWLQEIDQPDDWCPGLPSISDVDRWPRASAEIAVRLLRRAARHSSSDLRSCRNLTEQCIEKLGDLERRLIEIEYMSIIDPERFTDAGWRRETTHPHASLRRKYTHRRGLELYYAGRHRDAERMLRTLVGQEESPGRKGMLELDLGSVTQALTTSGDAAAHYHRAYRLLQAAGFRNKTRDILFNLGVDDLDHLDVRRAAERFHQASNGEGDVILMGEEARLALARGDLSEFRARVLTLPSISPRTDPRLDEGFSFLRGAGALLERDSSRAMPCLLNGGDEGAVWLDLARASIGEPREVANASDGWGVSIAADVLRGNKSGLLTGEDRRVELVEAFAVALADAVAGPLVGLTRTRRTQIADILEKNGLQGWASSLERSVPELIRPYAGLAQLVDGGTPSTLDERLVASLLIGLGVSGLEVRERRSGIVLWETGEGEPNPGVERGRLELVPLGNRTDNEDLLVLLGAILELVLPAHISADDSDSDGTGLLGVSEAMQQLRSEIRQFAESRVAVSFFGETGVGKDVAARALHKLSGRKGRFVPVNVASIPTDLLEAELFGSVRGAFTGADRSRTGLAAAADGGTLFLDEIGDLDLQLQVKLLRFAESQEVRPVGSDSLKNVNVRLVAATHQNLPERVNEGSFRRDLYYRIASAPIHIPPLRERREDIPMLRELFQDLAIQRDGLSPCPWSREASEALSRYGWPGNVRELRHVVEGALVRCRGGVVYPRHLLLPESVENTAPVGTWDESIEAFRRQLIRRALEQENGNRSAAARVLGISRQTLNYHMRNLGLRKS